MEQSRRVVECDDILDALGRGQRRRLLTALVDHNPQDDSSVGTTRADTDPFDERIAIKHVHLPKLEAYGFIDWDETTDEITRGPKFDVIRPLLELMIEHEDDLPPGWI